MLMKKNNLYDIIFNRISEGYDAIGEVFIDE